MASGAQPKRKPRWRYVLPNAITCGSMLVGLAAFKFAVVGEYLESAWLIILCVVLDKLDGTVARLLNATSTIGAQLDSFADFVSFGIAPSALVFSLIRGMPPDSGEGPFSWWHPDAASYLNHALSSVFVVCAAIRLAKFNVIKDAALDLTGTPVFYGLPSTMAGALIAAAVVVGIEHQWVEMLSALPVIVAGLGALMVLNFPMPKVSKRPSLLLNIFVFSNAALMITCGIIRLWPEYLLVMLVFFTGVGVVWGIIYGRTLETKTLDPYETDEGES